MYIKIKKYILKHFKIKKHHISQYQIHQKNG
jgi:hypothetical protein